MLGVLWGLPLFAGSALYEINPGTVGKATAVLVG